MAKKKAAKAVVTPEAAPVPPPAAAETKLTTPPARGDVDSTGGAEPPVDVITSPTTAMPDDAANAAEGTAKNAEAEALPAADIAPRPPVSPAPGLGFAVPPAAKPKAAPVVTGYVLPAPYDAHQRHQGKKASRQQA